MAKAFPLLKLFMPSTGWGAVSTIFEVFGTIWTRTRHLPIQILVYYYWIYSRYIELQEVYYCQSIYVHLLYSIDSSRFTNLKSGKDSIIRATYLNPCPHTAVASQNIFFLYLISSFLFIYLKESCPFYISKHIFLYISKHIFLYISMHPFWLFFCHFFYRYFH